MVRILLCGCFGKMGRAVQQLVADRTDCTIAAGVDLIRDASAAFPNYTQIEAVEEPVDVIVDFSHPSLLTPILSYAAQKGGIPAVLCTTGYSAEQVEALKAAAQTQPVFYSRNMSLGINLLIGRGCADPAVVRSPEDRNS